MSLASTPGISPRRIAMPTRAEVTLFETDCIVWSALRFQIGMPLGVVVVVGAGRPLSHEQAAVVVGVRSLEHDLAVPHHEHAVDVAVPAFGELTVECFEARRGRGPEPPESRSASLRGPRLRDRRGQGSGPGQEEQGEQREKAHRGHIMSGRRPHMHLSLAVLLAVAAPAAAEAPADLIFTGGRVFTADAARPWAEAVAVRGERIVRVGSRSRGGGLARPEDRGRRPRGAAPRPRASTTPTSTSSGARSRSSESG